MVSEANFMGKTGKRCPTRLLPGRGKPGQQHRTHRSWLAPTGSVVSDLLLIPDSQQQLLKLYLPRAAWDMRCRPEQKFTFDAPGGKISQGLAAVVKVVPFLSNFVKN